MKIKKYTIITILWFVIQACGSSEYKTYETPPPREPSSNGSEKPSFKEPVKPGKEDKSKKKELDSSSGVSDWDSYFPTEKSGSKEESKPSRPSAPESSGLKAGFADDNKQFNYFVNFLKSYNYAKHYPINISERIHIKVKDGTRTVPGATVKVYSGQEFIEEGKTYADGTFLFFPSEHDADKKYKLIIQKDKSSKEISLDRNGNRLVEVDLSSQSVPSSTGSMDIVFIFDTTGSMGEEIARLKSTIEIIHLNLSSSKNKVRFGMVLYKDRNDEYITRVVPLTSDLEVFKKELNRMVASGGGDGPEDLQSALKDTIQKINWNEDALKLAFIITDAPPHLDYGQTYNYASASKDAKKKGIKIHSIGTGGLDINGEYVLRQISQYTYGRYIFLTYGEKGDSEGGATGSVSHHTGANFQTDKLESIVIRFAKEDISFATGKPLEEGDEFFQAVSLNSEKREDTLKKLFDKSVIQILDYSAITIPKESPIGILPAVSDKKDEKNAEYFSEQILLAFLANKNFKVVERKDMQKILAEWKLSMTGITEENANKFGQLTGAKFLCYSTMYRKEKNFEIFMKLVSTETGEVVSATKAVIELKLGL